VVKAGIELGMEEMETWIDGLVDQETNLQTHTAIIGRVSTLQCCNGGMCSRVSVGFLWGRGIGPLTRQLLQESRPFRMMASGATGRAENSKDLEIKVCRPMELVSPSPVAVGVQPVRAEEWKRETHQWE
jgi:hypothetical protein